MRLMAAGLLLAALAFPASFHQRAPGIFSRHWKGLLVDARCPLIPGQIAAIERRGSDARLEPGLVYAPTLKTADRERCAAGAGTREFSLALADGRIVAFDAAGQSLAIRKLARNKGWQRALEDHRPMEIEIRGTLAGNTLQVESIKCRRSRIPSGG